MSAQSLVSETNGGVNILFTRCVIDRSVYVCWSCTCVIEIIMTAYASRIAYYKLCKDGIGSPYHWSPSHQVTHRESDHCQTRLLPPRHRPIGTDFSKTCRFPFFCSLSSCLSIPSPTPPSLSPSASVFYPTSMPSLPKVPLSPLLPGRTH